MARKSTGLRNRHRGGRGTYSRNRKNHAADSYGRYENGRLTVPERIREWIQPDGAGKAAR